MDNSFSLFLDTYLDVWRTSSFVNFKKIIALEYKAREITAGKIVDFGYEESIEGWEQGFHFAKENTAIWIIKVVLILPLREHETMAIISATLSINGKALETGNLFFQTFKKYNNNDWKLVRSYIEAGVKLEETKS
ncbi:flavoprotein [Lysinibacillus sp. NPDC097195]|uniref:flavoprotein n=1 Tax=Lysinibacillus sp. NPDC097195 TaxID=3364141 RepID=UPI0037F27ADA